MESSEHADFTLALLSPRVLAMLVMEEVAIAIQQ